MSSEPSGDPLRRWLRGPPVRLLAAVVLTVAAVALLAGGLAKLEIRTGLDSFMPRNEPTTEALNDVASSFGGDPIVVLAESEEDGELLANPRLEQLLAVEGELARLPDVASVYGPATVLNQIAGQAQDLLAELSGYRDGLRARAERDAREAGASQSEAHQAGIEATAEFDSRYGTLLVDGVPGGLPTLHNQRFIESVVFTDAGEPRPQWHFVVPAPDAVAVLVRPRQGLDSAATERLVGAIGHALDRAELDARRVTVSGVPVVVSALDAQVRKEIPILGAVALVALAAWFLLVRWTRPRYRLLPLLTTLAATGMTFSLFGWLGRPVALGAVAVLPILLGVGSDVMTYLHRRVGRRIVVAVAAATAASFGALAVIPVPAVRELGLTLTLGITLALAVTLLLARWVPGTRGAVNPAARRPGGAAAGRAWWARRPSRGVRYSVGAAVGALALTGWLVLPLVPLQADFQSLAADLPVLADAGHVEDVLGSSGELTLVVTGENTLSREALAWMRDAQDTIVAAHGDELRPTLSPPMLLRFLGASPTADQLEAALRLVPRYLATAVMRNDERMSVLSFGVRLDDAAGLATLRDGVLQALPPPPEGITAALTGLPMVALTAHELISGQRYLANVLGIVAAGTVLALVLRRRGDAVRAMAAAAIATGIGLLGMWLGGIPLTPITVALGSLTAAVGCEFTTVLAAAARRGSGVIARSVLLAAAASATGYAVLTLSELAIVRQFGALLVGTVALAMASSAFVVWLSVGAERRADSPRPSPSAHDNLVGVTS